MNFKILINPELNVLKMARGNGELSFNHVMTLKSDAKFKGKLTPGWKNDIRNLVNFHAGSRKSEYLHFDGSFCPTRIKF